MAKDTKSKAQPAVAVPLCCSKPDCQTYQEILFVLGMWDFHQQPGKDGGRLYLNLMIPQYWGKERRKTFVEALAKLPSRH